MSTFVPKLGTTKFLSILGWRYAFPIGCVMLVVPASHANCSDDPFGAGDIKESRKWNIFICPVHVDPNEFMLNGHKYQVSEAWAETRLIRQSNHRETGFGYNIGVKFIIDGKKEKERRFAKAENSLSLMHSKKHLSRQILRDRSIKHSFNVIGNDYQTSLDCTIENNDHINLHFSFPPLKTTEQNNPEFEKREEWRRQSERESIEALRKIFGADYPGRTNVGSANADK